jgi:hypothetical protein
MSSPKDETLLLRRFRLTGDSSVADPAYQLQQASAGPSADPPGGLAQPPSSNRLVRSVFDARPSFTREFQMVRFRDDVPVADGDGNFSSADFSFSCPSGYLGVLRRFNAWFGVPESTSNWYALLLLNGVPVPDFRSFGFDGTTGVPLVVSSSGGVMSIEQSEQDVYLEVPPGGTFGVRLINSGVAGGATAQAAVKVAGSFVRAENVPPELQVASPAQVTPVTFAKFGD